MLLIDRVSARIGWSAVFDRCDAAGNRAMSRCYQRQKIWWPAAHCQSRGSDSYPGIEDGLNKAYREGWRRELMVIAAELGIDPGQVGGDTS